MANPFEKFAEGGGGSDNPFAKFSDTQPKPDVGQGRAALEGYLSGASANFSDEIYGASKASGLPEWMGGFRAPVGAAKLIMEYLNGNPGEVTALYEKARNEKRAVQKDAQEQYPGTYAASGAVGALAVPGGALLQGATLPARMAGGAALGGIYGGLSGAGEGTTAEDRASRALVGAGAGAAIGAAGVPLVEGAARGVGFLAGRPVSMVRSAINPDDAAARAVGRAYQNAVEADPAAVSRLTPADLTGAGPATVMDALGGEGRNLARSAANLSGTGRDTLNQTLDARFENQGGRFADWFRQRFNYPDAFAQQQALDQVERVVNRAAYNNAYRAGDRPLWSPELERLAGSPAVQDALRSAITTGKDRAITQGFGGFRSPFTVTPDGRVTFNRGPNGVPTYPNLQFWDATRRELSNAASAAQRAGRNEDASRLGDLARSLNTELDQLVPAYQRARQGAAQFFGAENALEAGQRFVTENFALPQTRQALGRMSPAERQLFQDGFVSRYVEMLNNVPDRADVVRRIYNSPAAREKIDLVIGRQRANELEAMVRVETIMQQSLRSVQGNSTTAQQLITAGLAGGAAGAAGGGYLGYDPTISGVLVAALSAGRRGVDQRVAQRVAQMLVSHDPAMLQNAIRIVSNNPTLMSALRSFDSASVRIGSGQVPTTVPAIQAPIVGRAQEDEPSVPRPPGQ